MRVIIFAIFFICCACDEPPGVVPDDVSNNLPEEMAYFPVMATAGECGWEFNNYWESYGECGVYPNDAGHPELYVERYYPDAMEYTIDYYMRVLAERNFIPEENNDNNTGSMSAYDQLNDIFYAWVYQRHPDDGFIIAWQWVSNASILLAPDPVSELPIQMSLFPYLDGEIAYEFEERNDPNYPGAIYIERGYPKLTRTQLMRYARMLNAKGFATDDGEYNYYGDELSLYDASANHQYIWTYALAPDATSLDMGFIITWHWLPL